MSPRDDSAGLWLAQGFGQQVQRWALDAGADTSVAQSAALAAQALSLAVSDGHTCVSLDRLPALPSGARDSAAWRCALLASGLVSRPQEGALHRLMVLDDEDRLYLARHFEHERRLARRLADAATDVQSEPAGVAVGGGGVGPLDASQQRAIDQALAGRLTVISGGPGSGKTTIVARLLARLLEQTPRSRIALAAPTGKAAARMLQSLRQQGQHLPPEIQCLLPSQAFTVHRLLGAKGRGVFSHDAAHPLPIDVLVVDEASMLDLSLATHLLEAVPAAARIVLLGDKDQLSSVEAGAVFWPLCAVPELPPERLEPAVSAFCRRVVLLHRSHRFDPHAGIGRLAALVRQGRAQEAMHWLGQDPDPAVAWSDGGGEVAQHAMTQGYAAYAAAVRQAPQDVRGAMAAFSRFRVLCATRAGPQGVDAANERITRALQDLLSRRDARAGGAWFVGRAIIVERNDYGVGLFNGDTGIALPDAQGRLMVWFDRGPDGIQAVAPSRLPPHDTAFAMTVHKAQGSEFEAVLVLLPREGGLATSREALYTAVTRARRSVHLCATRDALLQAIATPAARQSGLLSRLLAALGTSASTSDEPV